MPSNGNEVISEAMEKRSGAKSGKEFNMSVSKWRYTEECDGEYCCGDCDFCDKEPEESEEETEWADT